MTREEKLHKIYKVIKKPNYLYIMWDDLVSWIWRKVELHKQVTVKLGSLYKNNKMPLDKQSEECIDYVLSLIESVE